MALALMVGSGFAGLGYQIVWTQQFALWLGHESAAVLAVVTAFFGGLAVGALVLGPRIHRCAQPERWYAACEVLIALWSLVLALGLAPIGQALVLVIGAQPAPAWHWAVAFLGTFIVLLPATAAMGATLPAMERLLSRLRDGNSSVAALYASNTAGAVLGVLAAAFWLVPEYGLTRTAAACAGLNLLCALAALALQPTRVLAPMPQGSADRRELALLVATGLLGIAYEVLAVRVLGQVAEDTVYTFALLLAVYLIGSAAGAAAYQRWMGNGSKQPHRLRERLLALQAVACLLGGWGLWQAQNIQRVVLQALGSSMASALASEAVMALAAFALPTVVMGALFSHLSVQAQGRGHSFGRALGFNTLGASIAPPLVALLLVPTLGPKAALLLIAAGYLVLALPRAWRSASLWCPAIATAIGAAAIWAPALTFVDVPEGGRLLGYHEGAMAAVSVVQDGAGVARLHINNHQQEGSSATPLADARQAWLPLLLHPAPQRALFLGLGTGVTASSAAEDTTLQVDAVELLPEVVTASAHFSAGAGAPQLNVMAADARRFVKTAATRYDVIVADNFHPARSGSGALYTVEHFQAVRERLAADGLFCQWLPLHQLDLDTLRSIVRTFVSVYPGGAALLATNSLETPVLGLVARADATRILLPQLRTRLAGAARQPLFDLGLGDDFAVLGGFVAGPQALARWAGEAPLNTDDRPVVAYRAPRVTYAPDSSPRQRLGMLLQQLRVEPAELVDAGGDPLWLMRLAAYWAARDRFIEAGQRIRVSTDVHQMLSQVREPLLSVLRTSPDFRPAYDPLLRMALALARTHPAEARSLLQQLDQALPARPEAGQALRRLMESPR